MAREIWGFCVGGKCRRAMLLALPIFLRVAGAMADIEHISKDVSLELKTQFAKAQTIHGREQSMLTNREWVCEMYGMRSRIQVERNVRLYNFRSDTHAREDGAARVKNLRGPLVEDYRFEASDLMGQKGWMRDRVRWLKRGREIISEIAMLGGEQASAQSPNANVIAYCKCK